jgi:hypothetical protein
MFRFALSVVALAGALAAAHPALADPLAAKATDHTQAAMPATEHPAPPAPARASSPDEPAPATTDRGKNIIFVGFGWG